MNRAEKRKQISIAKKKAEFAKKLTPVQKEYIDEIVELTKQNTMLLMADVLDTAMTGALVEDTDLSMEEIFKINMKTGLFIGEIQRQNIEFGVEERKMNLKKIEKEGIELIDELLRAGKTRGEIVKELRLLYKGTGITTAEINCAYKQVEEKLEREASEKIVEILGEADKETEELMEYNFNKANEIIEAAEVEEVEEKLEEEIKADQVKEFEIISKCIEVKGTYGQYKIQDNVMTINDAVVGFKETADIKEWYKNEREELERKIALLNAKEEEAIQALNKFM